MGPSQFWLVYMGRKITAVPYPSGEEVVHLSLPFYIVPEPGDILVRGGFFCFKSEVPGIVAAYLADIARENSIDLSQLVADIIIDPMLD